MPRILTLLKRTAIFLCYVMAVLLAMHISGRLTAWYWIKCDIASAGAFFGLLYFRLPFRLLTMIVACTAVYLLFRKRFRHPYLLHVLTLALIVTFFFAQNLWNGMDYHVINHFCVNGLPFSQGEYYYPGCEGNGCSIDKFLLDFRYWP